MDQAESALPEVERVSNVSSSPPTPPTPCRAAKISASAASSPLQVSLEAALKKKGRLKFAKRSRFCPLPGRRGYLCHQRRRVIAELSALLEAHACPVCFTQEVPE